MTSQSIREDRDDSYVIIGDGVAGSSAADVLAEQTDDASITVLTAESEPLYNRILIKEYAKGTVPEETVQIHDQAWYDERDIDLELDTRVSTIETDDNAVVTAAGERYHYDKLLVATGGTPRSLPVPNADAEGVTSFWTIEDARRIREKAAAAETGTIVGGGLLGIDYAAIAAAQDVDASYLIREDRWFSRAMSETGAAIVHDALDERGVTPVLETTVDHFETDDDGHVVATVDSEGDVYDSDCVGVAIGTESNTAFLEGTPIPVDDGVLVDGRLQTDDPDVYAAGDVAQYHDRRLGRPVKNGSWGSAAAQGEHAAENMLAPAGAGEHFEFVPSYTVTHFSFPMASFGHPGLGETYRERTYGETEWRRLAFRDGMLVGGVLIGDLSVLQPLKELTASGRRVQGRAGELLAPTFDGLADVTAASPIASD
ncbi:FAD-dependent pyridine nucleotide-disulphide oxidoreductase [Halorhabdus utahensis DSM 12940]|uniref:FAD-dependent pyridine nucleotide-disulphide oxidoreductase n=1 Tax=Halorhabdus utahensis (strain DSM 12940 / JCM 11049 / AX-2) TaxID=519442 RepID=C7NRP8_HALUD|nr:FAD-dependent oxidoreductase [Halorhabdus utahensis]ACV11984.1 FAD-dependent pyridine nucleotide-disulphide oxidoreductase [Halorhabdus utahensis DSM 12940]